VLSRLSLLGACTGPVRPASLIRVLRCDDMSPIVLLTAARGRPCLSTVAQYRTATPRS
jgi:hypothetical protein